ncbi:DUF4233 domain-containing protein [Plantactinospora sp. BB1]|uniref:DUF4233 domain-containing protein n=1 Tax=Plantactinospora sp. BB1 TaxID=2071627 RepID=UPI000D162BB7|nr:DUF4233 domain-containing protein [Plantactinospora sp. BB1]AVT40842.1 DUF4233 domain-containing protein [Plantactinospora sp. BB1]
MSAPDEAVNPADRAVDGGGRTGAAGRVDDGGSPGTPGGRPSGLRDPGRAVRGLGALTLSVETLVLLLAIQPIRLLGGDLGGAAIGVVVGLAVLAAVLAGCLRRPWAWHAATVLQGLLLLAGFLHWSLGALGLIFAAVWAYVLHVRRVILG